MRCLFVIQGEGRGHLTQALALQTALHGAGHEVIEAVVGHSETVQWPAFFVDAMQAPLTPVESLPIITDQTNGAVRSVATIQHAVQHLLFNTKTLDTLQAAIARTRPDLIVNFFEPTLGMLAAKRGVSVPMVALAHQYMFLHPGYRFPPGQWGRRQVARWFARCTAWGADHRIALSLYPAAPHVTPSLTVSPPLLRPEVRTRSIDDARSSYLQIYLVNAGYARQVMRWHEMNRHVPLRCFWARPGVTEPETVDDTLTIYPLSDSFFIESMARARGLACTAGFESIAEALYLGTPVQVVPVQGHYEQRCNAYDTVRAGAGIRDVQFDLDALLDFAPIYTVDTPAYRAWVQGAPQHIVRQLEQVATG